MRTIALPLICLLSLCACGSERSERGDPPALVDDEPSADPPKRDEAPRSPLASMFDSPFAALLTRQLDEPGRFDPPKESASFDPETPHLRVLKLAGSVGEVEILDPMALVTGGGGSSVQTRALLDKLDELAGEDKLEGLVLRVGDLNLDMARAEELRAGLIEFQSGGERKLYCHAEGLSNTSYYLLSACDELVLVPVGTLAIPGPVATPIHLAGLLAKLGVEAQFLHVGAFKGAAEPLTREAPSPEMIETLEAVVGLAYANMVAGIANGRQQDPEHVRAWIDEAIFNAEVAAERGLVDSVQAWEPFLARVSADRGWKQVTLETKPWADPGALQRFLGFDTSGASEQAHVAVVYAVGNIIDGHGGGAVGARSEIASGQLVPVFDRLAEDESVRAVLLRIDSGGGSARASEQIWHAVERLAGIKPVVVSMAGVAASGGYYIAAGANEIYADADTLTGSIGVVGGKIVIGAALEKLGVKSYAVGKGARAMLWSPMQAWTASEQAAVQGMMEQTYETFLERVAAGREMDRDAVHEVAQGRVWTGVDAKEHGLVDEIGGFEMALARTYELGRLDPKAEDTGALEVYPGEPTIKDLLGSFDQLVAVRGAQTGLPPSLELLVEGLGASVGPEGQAWIAALHRSLATLVQLSNSQVWAVEWLRGV